MFTRRDFLAGTGMATMGALAAPSLAYGAALFAQDTTPIAIDFGKTTGPLPHFWEKACGSDRTVVGLRDQWRQDLVRVRRDTGMQSVRSHGLFNDEMGLLRPAQAGSTFST